MPRIGIVTSLKRAPEKMSPRSAIRRSPPGLAALGYAIIRFSALQGKMGTWTARCKAIHKSIDYQSLKNI
jgi:hypothetical protein